MADPVNDDLVGRLEAVHRFYAHRAEMRRDAESKILAEIADLIRPSAGTGSHEGEGESA